MAQVKQSNWGFETEPQAAALCFHGCTLHQGYLYARPVPPESLQALMDAGAGLVQLHQVADYPKDFGDRAEVDLPDQYLAWREVSATGETCLGRECERYEECFVTQARARAAARQGAVGHHARPAAQRSLPVLCPKGIGAEAAGPA